MSHIDTHQFLHILGTMTLAPKEALMEIIKKDCAMFYFLCHKDFIFGMAYRLIARLIDYGLRIEAHFEAGLIPKLQLTLQFPPPHQKNIQFELNIVLMRTNWKLQISMKQIYVLMFVWTIPLCISKQLPNQIVKYTLS